MSEGQNNQLRTQSEADVAQIAPVLTETTFFQDRDIAITAGTTKLIEPDKLQQTLAELRRDPQAVRPHDANENWPDDYHPMDEMDTHFIIKSGGSVIAVSKSPDYTNHHKLQWFGVTEQQPRQSV